MNGLIEGAKVNGGRELLKVEGWLGEIEREVKPGGRIDLRGGVYRKFPRR
jgi:hypothetical protein